MQAQAISAHAARNQHIPVTKNSRCFAAPLAHSCGGFMRLARFLTFVSGAFLLLASATLFLFRSAPTASAQTTTPPSSTISSTTGPLAWDFAPVGGGTVTNVGIQDICPPGMCDDHDF